MTMRANVKSMVEQSSFEDLKKVYNNKNFEIKLTVDEQKLVMQKICEHCNFWSFANKKCEKGTSRRNCLLSKE